MNKRIGSLLLAAVMLLGLIFGTGGITLAAFAADDVTVKLHYHRNDGQYSDWDVWMWADGKDGAGYAFSSENGEMVATFKVPTGVTKIGYIVRKAADWTKDVGMDQFIEIPEVKSGTVHIYVESTVPGHRTVYSNDAQIIVAISEAEYDGKSAITVKTTAELTGDLKKAFTLTTGGTKVAIGSVTSKGNKTYSVIPASPLDNTMSYKLKYGESEVSVIMPIIFSTDWFEAEYTYTGNDLGATWTKEQTTFRVWAPTATNVKVNLYTSGDATKNDLIEQIPMTKDVNGTWIATKTGDLNGTYYTYVVDVAGKTNEAVDPYARTTGVNGNRGMVIDLDSTDPAGWENDKDPNANLGMTDIVIYELHVRDMSVHQSAGIQHAGKFLGIVESGTTPGGNATGLAHLKELGITHLHLLPSYDFATVDEANLSTPQFNWGYDPKNYNVPEGSYSTDPFNGEVRVKEMKQMVKTLHDNGISVIMDVVYNHVYSAGAFCFNQIVPNYFSRVSKNGTFSNGSGCGNDTASERSMVRKYIVESVKYWVDEYHIDGFRFDLVGLIDTQTINEIMTEVHKTHPNVIFYGEGWTMSTATTKNVTLCTQANADLVPGFAFFSDGFRDMIKGSVFSDTAKGYVTGGSGYGSAAVSTWKAITSWSRNPLQTVQYNSCHDNMTLFDRIMNSTKGEALENQIKMNNLAAAMTITAQGVTFIHAGEEMLRSKPNADGTFNHNSYNASDAVNNLKWSDLDNPTYKAVFEYYKGLIAFRKAHAALRLSTSEAIMQNITNLAAETNVTAMKIKGGMEGETADNLIVIFNPNKNATTVNLPEGAWDVYVNGEKAGTEILTTVQGSVTVDGISCVILAQDSNTKMPPAKDEEPADNTPWGLIAGVVLGGAAVAAAAAGITAVVIKKNNSK